MPPSTDCSAGMSCGGCLSYAGAVAVGRLNSSATATGFLHLLAGAPASPPRGEAGVRRAPPDRTCVRTLLPPGTDSSGRPAAAEEDVRKPGGRRPTPVCTSI